MRKVTSFRRLNAHTSRAGQKMAPVRLRAWKYPVTPVRYAAGTNLKKERRMEKRIKARIPKEAYQKLRHHGGGAHSTPKGAKGYKRAENKRILRESRKDKI